MFFSLLIFLALLILGVLVTEACMRWDEAWSKPALAVYLTVGMWYLGNLFYSGIPHFKDLFSDAIIQMALQQVSCFLLFLRICIPLACRFLVKNTQPVATAILPFHQQIVPLFIAIFVVWLILFMAGTVRLEGNILPVIWPPLAREKVQLFAHSGLGGSTGFLTASAQYSYQLVCAFFGIAFILGKGWVRIAAFFLICLTWPYFLFERMRNVQLAVVMPTLICYVLLGQARPIVKSMIAVCGFTLIYVWFILVGAYRSDYDMSHFLSVPKKSTSAFLESRHFGLDMLEELCYIDQFIEKGTYKINYGERYLGDALNFVPRAIWKNKPLLGYDYAIARGFANPKTGYREIGVVATIATGMIGQGVTNFGRFFGVLAAALIMAFWVALLARHWAERWKIGNAFLFILGLGLTFNLGRDITLLVLWPFVFASVGIWLLDKTTRQPVLTGNGGFKAPRRRRSN